MFSLKSRQNFPEDPPFASVKCEPEGSLWPKLQLKDAPSVVAVGLWFLVAFVSVVRAEMTVLFSQTFPAVTFGSVGGTALPAEGLVLLLPYMIVVAVIGMIVFAAYWNGRGIRRLEGEVA